MTVNMSPCDLGHAAGTVSLRLSLSLTEMKTMNPNSIIPNYHISLHVINAALTGQLLHNDVSEYDY